MCSCGSRTLPFVRNGYVKIILTVPVQLPWLLVLITIFPSLNQATKSQISKVFSSMLAIHADKPGMVLCPNVPLKCRTLHNGCTWIQTLWFSAALWIMAAKSELEDRGSSESARHLFLRGLRFHPNSQKVFQEVRGAFYSPHMGFISHPELLSSSSPSLNEIQYLWCFCLKYFRMELLHCEKLRKQKDDLEKAEMDLVSVALYICEILNGNSHLLFFA